jgi:hypothetical protein
MLGPLAEASGNMKNFNKRANPGLQTATPLELKIKKPYDRQIVFNTIRQPFRFSGVRSR